MRQLATQLTALGHPVSHTLVGELLRKMGYSLQANQKTKESATHPDRNAQFKFINARTKKELAAGNAKLRILEEKHYQRISAEFSWADRPGIVQRRSAIRSNRLFAEKRVEKLPMVVPSVSITANK